MKKRKKKKIKIISRINEHINNNLKEYLIIATVFLIGVVIGIIFINNTNEEQKENIGCYISDFTKKINEDYIIDFSNLLRTSTINNLLLTLFIWILGTTVIGIPIVYFIVGVKGFSLGFTISSIILTFSTWKGILFSLCSVLFQNIIFIPCLFMLAVSGIKLFKKIIKDKRRENIKIEIIKHTLFSALASVLLIISSSIGIYFSGNLVMACSDFFVI